MLEAEIEDVLGPAAASAAADVDAEPGCRNGWGKPPSRDARRAERIHSGARMRAFGVGGGHVETPCMFSRAGAASWPWFDAHHRPISRSLSPDVNLAFLFVDVDANMVHGWLPSACARERAGYRRCMPRSATAEQARRS